MRLAEKICALHTQCVYGPCSPGCNTIILSKTQTDIYRQEDIKKGIPKKLMIQTLLQSYAYIRKRSLLLGESNDAKIIAILKQIIIIHRRQMKMLQKRKVSGKRRNRNSFEITMPHKQPKMNRYLPSNMHITNSFKAFKEEQTLTLE